MIGIDTFTFLGFSLHTIVIKKLKTKIKIRNKAVSGSSACCSVSFDDVEDFNGFV